MARNHEVTVPHTLLDKNGELQEPGWSRSLIQTYDRTKIKAPKFRIKEWDYYLVLGDDFGVAFTVSDDGYIGLQSVSLLDFSGESPWEHTETVLNAFPMGKLHMPATSERGNVWYGDRRLAISYVKFSDRRRIVCEFQNFYNDLPLKAHIELQEPPMDSMVIATPWSETPKAFYYNQKINCMPASGFVEYGGKRYEFDPSRNFGTLDWGRGVWTYDNTWYWGSGNGVVDGKPFGFNLGYGFGNTAAASENVILYDGKAHKIDDIVFDIPENFGKKVYMERWEIHSSDGRFEAVFEPILDRAAKIDVKFIVTDQHQVFGKMKGKAILDDGTVLEFKDLLCFAEDVHNKY